MARQLSATDITDLESILKYHFDNPALLQEAVRAPQIEFPLGNRRLALLGEAVLEVALLTRWYITPGLGIGKFSYEHDKNLLDKSKDPSLLILNLPTEAAIDRLDFVTSDYNLDLKGTNAGLGPFIIRGLAQQLRPVTEGTMADTVMAILGAVNIDVGQDIRRVRPVMQALIIVPV